MDKDKLHQRWLAVGLLVLLVIIISFFTIVPLLSTGLDYYEQKNDLLFRLKRSKQIASKKDYIEENIEQIKAQFKKQNYFSTRDTVALASADIQRFIKSTISKAGGQLTSTQVLPSSNKDGFNKITVKVRMSADVNALRDILYEIEASTPIMIVEQLDIRPVRGKRNRKTRKIEPSNKLNINFQASSFMRTDIDE